MSRYWIHDQTQLTKYPKFEERAAGLDSCPNCANERISKTPRRKDGPGMFHCKKCGFIANIDQVFEARHLLGHIAA